jgi:hypothetical protein
MNNLWCYYSIEEVTSISFYIGQYLNGHKIYKDFNVVYGHDNPVRFLKAFHRALGKAYVQGKYDGTNCWEVEIT